MQFLALTQGYFATVDDEDFEWLNQHKWRYVDGYAKRYDPLSRVDIFMQHAIAEYHDLIFEPELDHIDRSRINNQKSNFRAATSSQNKANRNIFRNNTSGYIGVTWRKTKNKWRACIMHNGKNIELGLFKNKIDAAKAYDAAALIYREDRAVLNFPIRDTILINNQAPKEG